MVTKQEIRALIALVQGRLTALGNVLDEPGDHPAVRPTLSLMLDDTATLAAGVTRWLDSVAVARERAITSARCEPTGLVDPRLVVE